LLYGNCAVLIWMALFLETLQVVWFLNIILMKRIRYLLIFCSIWFFVACSRFDAKLEKNTIDSIPLYVIKKPNLAARIDSLTGDTIPVFISYYFDFNIILIDSLPQIYYHKKKWVCSGCMGAVTDEMDKHPRLIGLQPDMLIEVDGIDRLSQKLFSEDTTPNSVYIVSNRDSIYDLRYFALKDSLMNKGIHVSTRLLTQEEANVLTCVINDTTYNPNNYPWEYTNMKNIMVIDIEDENSK